MAKETIIYKLIFYVPESHLEVVKQSLFQAGAGQYNNYDQCCWQVLGEGQYRPLADSQPYKGKEYVLEKVAEYKVEMICAAHCISNVLQSLLANHPYEEPAYEVFRILTLDDFC